MKGASNERRGTTAARSTEEHSDAASTGAGAAERRRPETPGVARPPETGAALNARAWLVRTLELETTAMKRFFVALSIVVLGSFSTVSAQSGKRPISLDDLGRLREVRDPQCAPDGKSVAFVVSQIDVKE